LFSRREVTIEHEVPPQYSDLKKNHTFCKVYFQHLVNMLRKQSMMEQNWEIPTSKITRIILGKCPLMEQNKGLNFPDGLRIDKR